MKMILYIVGIATVIIGILGFLGNPVGLFESNMIQNIVHVILGLAILMSVMKSKAMLLKIVGIIFAIVGVLGFVMSGDTVLGIVVDSTATNSLHLVLGVVILLIAFMHKGGQSGSPSGGDYSAPSQPQMPPQQPNNPQM